MSNLAKNLIVVCQWADGAYNCTIDLWDDWNQAWEGSVKYCARAGDPAPVNKWILEQIETGAYAPVEACPVDPIVPPEPSSGPVVL